ncbi:HEPN domain-containing protein [Leptolyngbya sp. CCNP1308]|uniref:HEPN domain-containing protein n=1 Tax=Leptolyngbya sp. CCNP1308 TaxID=3110255 RepID=UPI002B20DA67|nr:HEPN domain-containing protein [Leptolyngbya sp. CCNP1308]MEA5452190.1 HEPN domain-containing protein [Leptolyngbya sp. CCNP1308]
MSKAEHHLEAARWLRYAAEDLRAAEAMLAQLAVEPRHICFLAQQAAEKSFKAVLIFEQIKFPFRHDLDELRNLVPEHWALSGCTVDLAELTEWAVEARYPTDDDDPIWEDAQRAVVQAKALYDVARSDLQRRGLG